MSYRIYRHFIISTGGGPPVPGSEVERIRDPDILLKFFHKTRSYSVAATNVLILTTGCSIENSQNN